METLALAMTVVRAWRWGSVHNLHRDGYPGHEYFGKVSEAAGFLGLAVSGAINQQEVLDARVDCDLWRRHCEVYSFTHVIWTYWISSFLIEGILLFAAVGAGALVAKLTKRPRPPGVDAFRHDI
jgi:hypothetical protein